MPRTALAKSVVALSMSWGAELTSAFDMGGGVARWGGTLGEPRWSGELEQRLMGRSFVGGPGGWSTAFGDSGGLHVGGQIVGDLVVLRDRAPKIDRAGGILRIDVVSSGWQGDHNAERA